MASIAEFQHVALAQRLDPALALAQQAGGDVGLMQLMLPAMMIMLLAYFMFVRPQQTRQQRFEQMLESLKENDQVVTTGGIHGVVTSIQRDAKRLTLRVDDATGAKIRVALWAISHRVGDDDAPDKTPETKT